MFGRSAEQAGFPGLQFGPIALQLFDLLFLLAQDFQIEIVLVFLFVLLAAQRQRFVEFCQLALRLLHAFVILAEALLQRLIAGMQGGQTLARRAGLVLQRHFGGYLFRRERQPVFRQTCQLLP